MPKLINLSVPSNVVIVILRMYFPRYLNILDLCSNHIGDAVEKVLQQENMDSIELSVLLLKKDNDNYSILIEDYECYFTHEIPVVGEQVAKMIYNITVNLLSVLDIISHDAEELWVKEDDDRFIKRYSKIDQVLKKMVQDLKSSAFKSEISKELPEEK